MNISSYSAEPLIYVENPKFNPDHMELNMFKRGENVQTQRKKLGGLDPHPE